MNDITQDMTEMFVGARTQCVVLVGLAVLAVLFMAMPVVAAAEEDEEPVTRELTGLTIVGAKETPKSLILVPWKDSNVDATTDFGSLVDTVEIEPVDRPTLERKMLFDELVRADLKIAREAKDEEAE